MTLAGGRYSAWHKEHFWCHLPALLVLHWPFGLSDAAEGERTEKAGR